MLLELRHDLIAAGKQERTWQWGMKAWAYGFSSPGRYKLGGKLASTFGNALPTKRLPGPLGGWTDYRSFPPFAKQSFRDLWQERIKQDE
jgi:L-lactate dehydrogenase complex protein LldF